VFLAQAEVKLSCPAAVEFTELAVLITLRIGFLILVPEQLEGNAFPFQLPVEVIHGRHLTLLLWDILSGRRVKQVLQSGIIQLWRKRPAETGIPGTEKIIAYRAAGDVAAFGNLPG